MKAGSSLPFAKEPPLPRLTAHDFPAPVLQLFDAYVHGSIDRRQFLRRAAKFAAGGLTAAGMLEALQPNFALAAEVSEADPRIATAYVDYASPKGSGAMRGYLARPSSLAAKLPGVLVIHENRGLNPYIMDVARRLAVDGFIAFAPDALSPLGGYPGDEDKARALFAQLDQSKTLQDFIAGYDLLGTRPDCSGKVGAVGFCWGGGMVNLLAINLPTLAAAVPFYGPIPPASEVARIKAPMLLHYAALDKGITSGWPSFEKALEAAHVDYQAYVYPDTQHGFHNDTTPRYDEAAAKLAWGRTIDFLNQHLKG